MQSHRQIEARAFPNRRPSSSRRHTRHHTHQIPGTLRTQVPSLATWWTDAASLSAPHRTSIPIQSSSLLETSCDVLSSVWSYGRKNSKSVWYVVSNTVYISREAVTSRCHPGSFELFQVFYRLCAPHVLLGPLIFPSYYMVICTYKLKLLIKKRFTRKEHAHPAKCASHTTEKPADK